VPVGIAVTVASAVAIAVATTIASAMTAAVPAATIFGEGRLLEIKNGQSDRRHGGDQEGGQESTNGRRHIALLVLFWCREASNGRLNGP
jgi:hypothetical protein